MKRKRNSCVGRRNIRITIYPKTDRSIGRSTGRQKKDKRLVVRPAGFSVAVTAYAGRDTVNHVGKITSKIINQVTGEINKIAQQRID